MKAINKKTLVFDLGGVLIDLHVERSFVAFMEMGVDKALLNEGKCIMNDMMQRYDRGDIDSESFFSYIEKFLPVENMNLSATAIREKVVEAWNMMLGDFSSDKLQYLNWLRDRGYRIVMLSNTNEGHWDTIEKKFHNAAGVELNSVFHALYLSYKMHYRKPEREIFLELLRCEGIAPEDTLFIDDSEENCEAARTVGIEALHVERNSSWTGLLVGNL